MNGEIYKEMCSFNYNAVSVLSYEVIGTKLPRENMASPFFSKPEYDL